MQTRKKYIFLAFLASWLLLFLFGGDQLRRFALFSVRKAESPRSWPRWTDRSLLRSFAEPEELQRDGDPALLSPRARRAAWLSAHRSSRCRMESCFDLSRCERNGFKVFTYPQERGQPVSETYSKILSSIERSRYHTARPEEACLFILSADTLDRDRLSEHYVRDLEGKIHGSPLWNGGRNHLIFNLYSGTWPGYGGELGFDPGHAILARASSDSRTFRPGFDVSIPLIPREHPQRGGRRGRLAEVPPKRRFLLAFKGKRYLTGIGSGTRNALHHIHNGKDIISLTTCKHGKDWHRHKDTRCDKDNVDYERFDYQELLHNSTFCIVPRGRRLGSFRFLEALQAACIPVLLSDGWELPFAEAIDWGKAAVVGSERLLLQIPSAVRCIRPERVLAFQQQTQFLWDAYFSSVDKIVHTTLEVSPPRPPSPLPGHGRGSGASLAPPADHPRPAGPGPLPLPPPLERAARGAPGAARVLHAPRGFSLLLPAPRLQPLQEVHGFHPGGLAGGLAVPAPPQAHPSRVWIPVLRPDRGPMELREAAAPEREMAPEQRAHDHHPGQEEAQRPLLPVRGHPDGRGAEPGRGHQPVHQRGGFCLLGVAQLPRAHRGLPHAEPLLGRRAGPLGLHVPLDQRGVHGARRRRLLPPVPARHGAGGLGRVSPTPWPSPRSPHRYYHSLFTEHLPAGLRELPACQDVLLNALVAAVTKLPPIKVTQRKRHEEGAARQAGCGDDGAAGTPPGPPPAPAGARRTEGGRRLWQRQDCLNQLANWFGYMPLVSSRLRLDPVLFKDQVSVLRKKYPSLERP
ncbi:exostosin-like 1 isoform X1 [Ammospiza caudacuta]|uniref:exostosin-like 1 isoform X1 n=1 Tax=Ammospiza caudacuta TaxID=2857398 RepID=UPI0027387071|nr:exostosin-like 1 isoform X1 [Ammospiza caudacuta]XP_058675852.1 exostosin-like 1 isoform X1 [Ammospiza caudacuta]